jgi:hypothetical protein
MTDEKVRENRLRRKAERQGLKLVKSRRRDPLALDYQLYALISEKEYKIAGGWQREAASASQSTRSRTTSTAGGSHDRPPHPFALPEQLQEKTRLCGGFSSGRAWD